MKITFEDAVVIIMIACIIGVVIYGSIIASQIFENNMKISCSIGSLEKINYYADMEKLCHNDNCTQYFVQRMNNSIQEIDRCLK